ncbi:FliI/YscN family ATPase [Acidicapsa ligni]|uniref:FliI/YscN family ATPase n=1 Tax=Acidicapsa ligni TaxID=542300 RepID=UPI00295B4BE5|nr:FliI/YscN family ATPase [Acidicapsa ligni]
MNSSPTADASMLERYFQSLRRGQPWRWKGRVLEAIGQTIESTGPISSVGECCEIIDQQGCAHLAEVIGFRGSTVLSMPVNSSEGIRYGDTVEALGTSPEIAVGPALMGRVLNALGEPIDGGRKLISTDALRLDGPVRLPLERTPIRTPLGTGIRVLDALLTVGRGQRIGIFGGSGVGKSTLIGMMTRNTEADVTVVGLVGERGREVGEFLEDALGDEGLKRSVVLVSTSDQSPLMRIRAALAATSVAEHYAAQGKHVLLVLDSLTRFAMAAREIGLAAGEPTTAKGYTPSVFSRLAKLVERAGNFKTGSITAFYTVLMEGDDQQDPLVDAVRSLLDGHVVLSRALAAEGWYPPVAVLDSISRLMSAVAGSDHRDAAALVRRLMAAYARSEDLVRIGAYKPGSDEDLDRALQARPLLRDFLAQRSQEHVHFEDCIAKLLELADTI